MIINYDLDKCGPEMDNMGSNDGSNEGVILGLIEGLMEKSSEDCCIVGDIVVSIDG